MIIRTQSEQRMFIYRERNRNIRAMGYASYADYLKSDLWRGIRQRVLSSKPPCMACGKPATQAHHAKYRKKDLEGRDLAFIMPVCSGCHYRAEFRDEDGEKLTPKQATTKLKQMARRRKS